MTGPDDLDAGLRAAFGASAPDSVLKKLEGVAPRPILLRDDADPTPVVTPRGATSQGRYQVVGEIARGGVGVVLKGRDVDLGRDVAMKVLREEHGENPEVLQRFVEEAQIGGQLQHPGIVPVYELGLGHDRRPFFTMKLVKGRTLATLLAERGDPAQDRRRFLTIFEAVCHTLAYAHARGVIHRDLKPANVMVGAFGEVLVVDWGMGKVLRQGGTADERRQRAAADLSIVATVRSEGSGSQSVAGSVMGTPRYMPPEQARGEVEGMDERSDVFSLGAILCEILTGEPPYRGDAHDVYRQAARGDLADAFARLAACGADEELKALALECLAAAARARPRDAREVGRRVTAYLASVEERARAAQTAAAEARVRAAEERKRRKVTTALAAAVLALVVLGGGGGMWLAAEQRAREAEATRRVALALDEVSSLRGRAAQADDPALWAEATAAARAIVADDAGAAARERARALRAAVEAEASAARARADRRRKDEAFVARLEQIREELAESWDAAGSAAAYTRAFEDYGLDPLTLPLETAAAAIEASPIRLPVVLALDYWITLLKDPGPEKTALEALVRRVDGDLWRTRVRDAKDLASLVTLVAEADVDQAPVESLLALVRRLEKEGDRATAKGLAVRVQERHPDDFWACFSAGLTHESKSPNRGDVSFWKGRATPRIRYYTAAVALRPGSADARGNLASALSDEGSFASAAAECREAIRIRPDKAGFHNCLGIALHRQGDFAGAAAAYREAIRLDPKSALPLANLGQTLASTGDLPGAEAACREAIRLDPRLEMAHVNLGCVLEKRGALEEAATAFRATISVEPDSAHAYRGLGRVLRSQGKWPDAEAAFRAAIGLRPDLPFAYVELAHVLTSLERFEESAQMSREAIRLDPADADAHFQLGTALLSLRGIEEAAEALREAIRLDPALPYAHANLGRALKALGDLVGAEAALREAVRLEPAQAQLRLDLGLLLQARRDWEGVITEYRESFRLDPDQPQARQLLLAIGEAQQHLGRYAEGLETLRDAHARFPGWQFRDEVLGAAERYVALADRLAGVIEGTDRPRDAMEALTFAEMARHSEHHAAAARLFTRAVELDPRIVEAFWLDPGFHAAVTASLAAAGQGCDAATASAADRVAWRKQAVALLSAELSHWARTLEHPASRPAASVPRVLQIWKANPGLALIRDPASIAALPPDEQEACRALWRKVDALLERMRGGR